MAAGLGAVFLGSALGVVFLAGALLGAVFFTGLAAAVSACVVSAALFSSFGADWRGPLDSILAYATYLRRGSDAGIHDHPWYFYLELLTWSRPARGFLWTEAMIIGLAAVGFVTSLAMRCDGSQPRAVQISEVSETSEV